MRKEVDDEVPVLFLPGGVAPEVWVWQALIDRRDQAAARFGSDSGGLADEIERQNIVFDSASDSAAEIAKAKLRGIAEYLRRTTPDVCRVVARLEAERTDSDLQPLVEGLEAAILQWRGPSSH